MYQPIDSLGLFGQDPFNDFQTRGRIFTATGDSGQGMTGGTTAGQCIAAAILNQRDPYKDVSPQGSAPSDQLRCMHSMGRGPGSLIRWP